jgi:hypothetical protein
LPPLGLLSLKLLVAEESELSATPTLLLMSG